MPSAFVFPEAYFESRKQVSTVTHFNYFDLENLMKINVFSPKGANNSQNTWKHQDFHRTEGQNPASAYTFPEAYFESRKKVATVTHLKRES